MGSISKSFTLILILFMAISSLSLLIIKSASAQSIPKPSVPVFTLKFENGTSYQPAIYSIDPYTGKNVTVSLAKYGEWSDILLTVKNQPFTPYKDSNGTWIELYYVAQAKGYYSTLWAGVATASGDSYVAQSNSENTTLEFMAENYPPNSQVDYEVRAMIGYFKDSNISPTYLFPQVFVGQTSDWSNTQTITLPTSSTSASPSPTPTVPEFSWLIILPLLLFMFAMAVIIRARKISLKN